VSGIAMVYGSRRRLKGKTFEGKRNQERKRQRGRRSRRRLKGNKFEGKTNQE
jgi:hypothetical protein